MRTLNAEQARRLHARLLAATGGMDGVRDEGALESALNAPFQSFGGDDFYPSTMAKIARLACGLVRNHPFVDGNKRIGVYVMLALLELSGIDVDFGDEDLIDIGLRLAKDIVDDKWLVERIMEHTVN
jgi:death-on-curing protein